MGHKHKDRRNVNQTWRSQNLINSDKSQEIKPKFNQTFADYPKREDSSDIGRFGEGDIEKDDIEEDDFEENTNFCSGETHSISNVKNRINNFVKQIDEIPY